MLDHLLFPSGISVGVARLEASKLASAKCIPISQALDEVARQHCANMTWSQAMDWLASEPVPLAIFSLPLRGDQELQAQVMQDANTVVLLGAPGTGKSALSLILAEQVLTRQASADVHVVSGFAVIDCGSDDESFSAERYVRSLMAAHPDRMKRHCLPPSGELPGAGSPRGSIIILDEINTLPRAVAFSDRLAQYMEVTKERGHVLVVCGQTAADVFADAIPKGVDTMMLAPFHEYGQLTTFEAMTMKKVLAQLEGKRGVYTEFLVVTQGRTAIAQIPIPQL